MKKLIGIFLTGILALGLTACGNSSSAMQNSAESQTEKGKIAPVEIPEQETGQPENGYAQAEADSEGNKTLIAYFSRSGNTKRLAEIIQEQVGGDLFEIKTSAPYPEDYDSILDQARQEQRDNARPELTLPVENMEDYQTIFIGYPIWWGNTPMAVLTFLESYDFTDKTVVPFCTYGSSGAGSSFQSVSDAVPGAVMFDGFSISGSQAEESQNDVQSWLGSLDLGYRSIQAKTPDSFNLETKTVRLNSGYDMPIVGLGTYSLSDEECYQSVLVLLENGGRLIDTAYMYHNEAAVGRAVRDSGIPREEIFVTTKIYPTQFDDPRQAIEEALVKLDIEYIDLMLLHHPGTGDVEAYKVMEQYVADGKIKSIGLSNWYIEELEEFLPQISITPAVVQNEIHPYYQETDVIPYIQKLGIVVESWYPLGGRGHTKELLTNEVISSIADAHGVSSAQVILRWDIQNGVIVMPGSSNPEHIKENLDIFGFELTDDEMEQIKVLNRDEKHDWY